MLEYCGKICQQSDQPFPLISGSSHRSICILLLSTVGCSSRGNQMFTILNYITRCLMEISFTLHLLRCWNFDTGFNCSQVITPNLWIAFVFVSLHKSKNWLFSSICNFYSELLDEHFELIYSICVASEIVLDFQAYYFYYIILYYKDTVKYQYTQSWIEVELIWKSEKAQ